VTLDLTTPEVELKRKAKPVSDRLKTRWLNSGMVRHKRYQLAKPPTFTALSGNEDNEDAADGDGAENEEEEDQEDQEDQDDESDSPERPENTATQAENKPVKPTNVQILDLHTSNPIVSYNGQVFSCQWAQNIGTELLFTPHDKSSSLPILRNLLGNVDLLAASSTRIISEPVTVKPKAPVRKPLPAARPRAPASQISLPKNASVQKRSQASFLEKLIWIKEAKGEEDLVTVHARARATNWRWRQLADGNRNLERTRLQNVIRKRGKDSEEVVQARAKLEELDREAEEIAVVRAAKKRKRGRKPLEGGLGSSPPKKGRPRKMRGTNGQPTTGRVDDGFSSHGFGTPTPDWNSLAAETPLVMDDEEDRTEDSEDEEEEEKSDDGESEEDQLHYDEDEDAPGELDDTNLYDAFG
jgi:hypothetical protein